VVSVERGAGAEFHLQVQNRNRFSSRLSLRAMIHHRQFPDLGSVWVLYNNSTSMSS